MCWSPEQLDGSVFHAHLRELIANSMEHAGDIVVLFDTDSPLATALAAAYQAVAPQARAWAFATWAPEALETALRALGGEVLVILVQSQSFRLAHYRIRVELYKQGCKVVEHANLARYTLDEAAHYVAALGYDATYYRGVGRRLAARVDAASMLQMVTHVGDQRHTLSAIGLEPAKVNLGDYAGLANRGSMYPIGEVITEARELAALRGEVALFAFADLGFRVNFVERPIVLTIVDGKVLAVAASVPAFDEVLAAITAAEGCVWVRELGLGLNRALGRTRRVRDVGAFERMCGVHLSLGAKHGLYKKSEIRTKDARFHVDVFPAIDEVWLDADRVFAAEAWRV